MCAAYVADAAHAALGRGVAKLAKRLSGKGLCLLGPAFGAASELLERMAEPSEIENPSDKLLQINMELLSLMYGPLRLPC